jgi:hypothetical protein
MPYELIGIGQIFIANNSNLYISLHIDVQRDACQGQSRGTDMIEIRDAELSLARPTERKEDAIL